MKSIFELFGFLSMACISAAIIFILMGKKDILTAASVDAKPDLYGEVADAPGSPKSVTKGSKGNYDSDSGSARRAKSNRAEAASDNRVAPEERLKSLYNDQDFVHATVNKWRGDVSDMADDYNVKPQVLLAHVVVQSYLGEYGKGDLKRDAAQHAGDRVMTATAAAKRYEFGWSVQKVMEQNRFDQYFAEEVATASAGVPTRMVSSKNVAAKPESTSRNHSVKVTPTAKNAPMEEGFKSMVAKEYGFATWAGLERLADADMKTEAQRKVKSLMLAARVK
ncbi:MAG: hypothetical protein JNJ57_06355 [Saprospiraceae bacterium]|nr:hypothetical protein [Saprospiraceae bacterium]